jgi:hypothetical protein
MALSAQLQGGFSDEPGTKIPTPPVPGQATVLLVIDVQQGLFRKSTPIYRAEPLLNTLTTLIERAHDAGVPACP